MFLLFLAVTATARLMSSLPMVSCMSAGVSVRRGSFMFLLFLAVTATARLMSSLPMVSCMSAGVSQRRGSFMFFCFFFFSCLTYC